MTTREAEEGAGEVRDGTPASRGLLTLVLAGFGALGAVVAVMIALGARGGRESTIPERAANTNLPASEEREVRTAQSDQVKRELENVKAQWNAGLEQLERWKGEMLETLADASKKADAVVKGIEGRIEVFEEQGRGFSAALKDVADLKQSLKELAATVKELRDRPVVVAQVPTTPAPSTGPAPPPPTASPSSGPTPEEIAANKEKAKQALQELSSDDAMKVFNATITLGRHGGPEAVEPLLKVLKENKDFYPRMGAANALERLKACDAVVPLIDALLDKDSNVFVSASKALIGITGVGEKDLTDLNLVVASDTSKQRRNEAKIKWLSWWRQHEEEIRTRLNQPARAGGAAPPQNPDQPK